MPKSAGYSFLGGTMNANKPPRTYPEQLQILKSRGLGVTDETEAPRWPQRLLRHLLTLDPKLVPHMGFPENWQTRSLWQNFLPQGGTP